MFACLYAMYEWNVCMHYIIIHKCSLIMLSLFLLSLHCELPSHGKCQVTMISPSAILKCGVSALFASLVFIK
jgi:hypothetical protein